MASRTNERDESIHDGALESYHLAQWKEPKRSTVAFANFIEGRIKASRRILDLGCGAGAATSYLAASHSQAKFVGIDLSAKLIGIAGALSAGEQFPNLSFEVGDWFKLKSYPDVDGVVSLQTLSWLPEFEGPLRQIFEKVAPDWIAVSSLFYEGDISCKIEVEEHAADKRFFYNVYSIPAVSRFAGKYGYCVAEARPFEIDIDLPPPSDKNAMATYTVRTAEPGAPKRIQLSGPLLMNWHFVMLQKKSV